MRIQSEAILEFTQFFCALSNEKYVIQMSSVMSWWANCVRRKLASGHVMIQAVYIAVAWTRTEIAVYRACLSTLLPKFSMSFFLFVCSE